MVLLRFWAPITSVFKEGSMVEMMSLEEIRTVPLGADFCEEVEPHPTKITVLNNAKTLATNNFFNFIENTSFSTIICLSLHS